MSFIEDFVEEMNKLPIYEVTTKEKTVKTVECSLVCDLITVLLDKYGLEERIHDDLHG